MNPNIYFAYMCFLASEKATDLYSLFEAFKDKAEYGKYRLGIRINAVALKQYMLSKQEHIFEKEKMWQRFTHNIFFAFLRDYGYKI